MHPAYTLMALAWLGVAVWVTIVILTNRKVHPKALFALFMVELWERFSYYGMRALLVLYMTAELIRGGFGFDDAKSYGIYAAYGALVYLTPLMGGVLADKMMGFRKAILWGALLMAAGQFTLFLDNQTTFYIGLALLVIGNGFFKPNISSMIGKFYPEGDPRRDGAFTIFYMGINIGAFLTPLTCGTIGELEGWKWGFFTAGVGMLIGYLIFLWAQRGGWYEDKGLPPPPEEQQPILGMSARIFPYVVTIALIPIAWLLITNDQVMSWLLGIVGGGTLLYLLISSKEYDRKQQQRIWVIVILLLFTTIFWTFFELAGSALNLFTERNVNKQILGAELTTTFFQSVNPLFIMIFAPVFSWLWIKLARSGREPAAPFKFAAGLILLGAGFLALNLGNPYAVAGMVPAFFLILLYLLHTLGELTLSPVGLSMVTKLAPAKIVGFMMGVWFLSSSIAHQAGAPIAKLTSVNEPEIVASPSFQACYGDPIVEEAIAAPFFQNWLANNKVIKKGEVDPCEGLQGEELDLCRNKNRLEQAMVNPLFVAYLNEKAGGEVYYASQVQIKEKKEKAEALSNEKAREDALAGSFVRFLTKDANFSDPNNIRILGTDEASGIFEASTSGEVVSCLKQDSLKLGLGVFSKLGFIAISCGILLMLLGPMISRWMHGIK